MERVFISTSSFGKYDTASIRILEEKGLKVALNPYSRTLTTEEIIHFLDGAVGLIAGTEALNRKVLNSSHLLRVISRCGAGTDNIDLKATEALGIKVFNTPDAPILAVAELTIGLILNLLRKVILMHISIKNDKWQKEMGNLLLHKKVGIIGFGKIGRKVSSLLKGFGCEMAYADPHVEDGLMGLKRLPISELLIWADIISIHVSGQDRIIGKREIEIMKEGSWLINTSRGGVIDKDALYHALKQGRLAGAAIDVFEQEPYTGPLKELDNVILTPHIGSYAKEARIKMEIEAAQNLLKGLQER